MADRPGPRRSAADDVPLHRYARAIERAWERLHERPVVLSPRDWSILSRWYEEGIPLELIRETMTELAERAAARGAGLRSLSYVAAAVEESWSAVLDGRRGGEPGPGSTPPGSAVEAWRLRSDREPRGSALRALLERLLERRTSGESGAVLDAALDAALPGAVAREETARIDAAVERELAAYRGRIPRQRLEATLRRARVERLRRHLGLPRFHEDDDVSGGATERGDR